MCTKQGSKKDPKQSTKRETTKGSKRINHQTQQQRKAREKEIIENINRENIQKYLKKMQEESKKIESIDKATMETIEKVAQHVAQGTLIIPDNQSPLPPKQVVIPKLTYEQQRQLESKAKRQNITKKIQYFYEQIRGQNQRSPKNQNSSVVEFKQILTKDQHERKIRELQQQKQQRQKRFQEQQEEKQRRQKQEAQRQQQTKEQQAKKAKQEKKLKIKLNMNKRKQLHEKFLESEQRLEKQRIALCKRPKMFQQMQQNYKSQILLPYLQEKKNRLKQLRDFNKQYQPDAVRQHQRQYSQKSLQKSRDKKVSQVNWKYDPPAKTQRLQRILQEQEAERLNKLQGRKRRIQQMQQRQSNFKQQLKEKYKPKIDEQKKKQIESRFLEQQQKREKINSIIGLNARQIGKEYLQTIKKMKRSESVKFNSIKQPISRQSRQSSSLKSQTKQSVFRLKNHSQQYYEDVRRKKIDEIVNSQESSINQKYLMLRLQAEKISQKLKQKQDLIKLKITEEDQQDAAELMLSSIKAKMGIVNLLKKNEGPSKKIG